MTREEKEAYRNRLRWLRRAARYYADALYHLSRQDYWSASTCLRGALVVFTGVLPE